MKALYQSIPEQTTQSRLMEQHGQSCLQRVVRIKGRLDEAMVKQSISLLCCRHPILQRVNVRLGVIDLRAELPMIQRQELEELAEAEKGAIRRDDPARIALIQLGHEQAALIWSIHPAMADDESILIIMRDLLEYHARLADGQAFEELANQAKQTVSPGYNDYLSWLEELDASKGRAYWNHLLAGWEAYSSKRLGIGPAGMERLQLDEFLSDKLRDFAHHYGLSAAIVLKAACGVLLQRLNGSNDAVFAQDVRQTGFDGIEGVVGPVARTIPVRVEAGKESVLQLMFGMQKQELDSRHYSFCAPSWSGELDTLYMYKEQANITIGGLEMRFDPPAETSRSLTICGVDDGRICLDISYHKGMYSGREARALLQMMSALLQNMLGNPSGKVSSIGFGSTVLGGAINTN